MALINFLLVIPSLLSRFGQCHITRLPCMVYGNFLIRHDNHFYQGTILDKKIMSNEFNCGVSCMNHSRCTFYNYFKHNITCSLLTSDVIGITREMLTAMTDASFLSTDYSTPNVSAKLSLYNALVFHVFRFFELTQIWINFFQFKV